MSNNLSSKEYWEKREGYKLKKGLKDLKKIEKELVKAYKEAMDNIGKEISNLFYKYADDNNLSYKDAKKLLNGKEYKEFKRDLKTYMKLIEGTGDEELLLELNTLSMKSRISRLEEIFYQCDKYINEVYESTNNKLQIVYTCTIKDNYYQTIYDIHKSIGVGASFSYIDNDMIKEILAFPWSGRNYGERLWTNRTKLKNAMVEELTQMLIQGKGVKEVSKALSKRLDADLKNCIRLIHTEHSYFMSEATSKAYNELGVKKYQFVATLDNRTSEICQKLDGKVFDLKDRVVGVNASPMHPRCRSCEIPYIENDYSTRFARDAEGKRIEVPSDMTYKEWEKAIEENNLEEVIKNKNKANESKKEINKASIKEENKNKKAFNKGGQEIQFNLEGMKDDAKKRVVDTITELSSKYNTSLNTVNRGAGGVAGKVDAGMNMYLSSTKISDIVHEFAHSLSTTNREKLKLSNDKEFWKEMKKLNKEYKKVINSDRSKLISTYSTESVDEFLAEGFVLSYLREDIKNPWYGKDFEYADKVMAIVNKYFLKY